MEWIGQAHAKLHALLTPELSADIAARSELRAAGVAPHRIDALYPFDSFAHIDPISRLLYDHELISLLHHPLRALNLNGWKRFSPTEITTEISHAFHRIYMADGSECYFLTHAGKQSKKLTVAPNRDGSGRNAFDARRMAASTLLVLPLTLDAFARYPFESQAWGSYGRQMFEEHGRAAEEGVRKLLNLIQIYKR